MSPRNSCLAVKMGGAIPFDGESFCAELGPLSEQDRAKASTACPTCGLTANSTTSGVLKVERGVGEQRAAVELGYHSAAGVGDCLKTTAATDHSNNSAWLPVRTRINSAAVTL